MEEPGWPGKHETLNKERKKKWKQNPDNNSLFSCRLKRKNIQFRTLYFYALQRCYLLFQTQVSIMTDETSIIFVVVFLKELVAALMR